MAFFEFFDISYAIYIRVMKLDQKVAYEETFKMRCHRLTLIKGQGHRVHLKFWKMAFFEFFDNISFAIYITVMKLGQKVGYEKTFQMMRHRSTLTKGQGHKINLKCGN